MKYAKLLDKFNELTSIPETEWAKVENLIREKKVLKGTKLLQPGEPSSSFFIVVEGLLRMYYCNDNGQEFSCSFTGPSDIASSYADMLQGRPSRATIESLVDSTVLEITHKDFLDLQKGHNCWKELAHRLTEIHFILRDQREYEFLVLSIKDRYENFIKKFPAIKAQIPQYQIASFLGVTPVTLSRALKQK